MKLPTLLVRGGLSDVLSEEGAREFLRLCPLCEYVSVTDAAHMVAGDRNDIFGNAVIAFLGASYRSTARRLIRRTSYPIGIRGRQDISMQQNSPPRWFTEAWRFRSTGARSR